MNSPMLSKINWTQVVGFVATMLTVFGLELPAETQVAIVAAITAVQSLVTIIWRTWFTKTV